MWNYSSFLRLNINVKFIEPNKSQILATSAGFTTAEVFELNIKPHWVCILASQVLIRLACCFYSSQSQKLLYSLSASVTRILYTEAVALRRFVPLFPVASSHSSWPNNTIIHNHRKPEQSFAHKINSLVEVIHLRRDSFNYGIQSPIPLIRVIIVQQQQPPKYHLQQSSCVVVRCELN